MIPEAAQQRQVLFQALGLRQPFIAEVPRHAFDGLRPRQPRLVAGSPANIKITYPQDLPLAAWTLERGGGP